MLDLYIKMGLLTNGGKSIKLLAAHVMQEFQLLTKGGFGSMQKLPNFARK